jgi:hypothetical protein
MLMAAGVNLGMDEIVPIIIDPDAANADLTRTVSLMNSYVKIHSMLSFPSGTANKFFEVGIKRSLQNYNLLIKDTDTKSFRNFIGLPGMNKENEAMMEMLFSEKNLESKMDVGFKGNPNIGSVVLNQIVSSTDFISFANSFEPGDKIFIVSSIFGGTGASGFPLLLKTLRTDKTIPNFAIINNSEIGAITLLPYFQIKQDSESEIDSSTFISKTKSALAYYENNVVKNNQINALYYLADDTKNTYDNHEGGSHQRNDAHLMEFLSATAIVDFCHNTYIGNSVNKELGVNNIYGDSAVSFQNFDNSLISMLRFPLTQFTLMANCITQNLSDLETLDLCHSFPENYFMGDFVSDIKYFMALYREWLSEMKKNRRSLDLFNLECGNKPFDVITNGTVYKAKSLKRDYDLFYDRLNQFKDKKGNNENKLMEIFYLATEKLIKEKFKF